MAERNTFTNNVYFFKSLLAFGLAALGASSPVANSTLDARIIRGAYAEAYTAPSFCGIYRQNQNNEYDYVCGSTLISEQTLVATAVRLSPAGNYFAKCGSNSLLGGPFEMLSIDTIKIHPAFGQKAGDTQSNNIALAFLKNPIQCSNRIQFAEVQTDFIDDSQTANYRVYGFGRDTLPTGTDENQPTWAFKYLDSKNYDTEKCATYFKNLLYFPSVPAGTFCATRKDPMGTPCQLDQGGPLFNTDNGRFVGIFSYGGICSLDIPSVYISVQYFSRWISANQLPKLLQSIPEKQNPWP